MTEGEYDKVYDLVQAIDDAVCDLVANMLKGQPAEIDDAVRERLTENFRFWR